MENISLDSNEKILSQEAINVFTKIQRRYGKVKLHQYVNWCIIKKVDIKVSSEIIVHYINSILNKEEKNNQIMVELIENLTGITNKKKITYKDENKGYEIMSDIAFIIENSYTNTQRKSAYKIKFILTKVLKWFNKIF